MANLKGVEVFAPATAQNCPLKTEDCRLETADWRLPTGNCPLLALTYRMNGPRLESRGYSISLA